jgi:hypothetical protein
MANSNETGHAKNVALFDKSIRCVKGYGSKYAPALPRIQVGSLSQTLSAAEHSLQKVKENKTVWNNATNSREIAFNEFKGLSTRVVKALKATDATDQTMADAKNAYRKIRGTRAKAITPPVQAVGAAPAVKKTKSVSQQSYDKMVDHFNELINTVAAEPSYAPNENELQVASLRSVLAKLKAKNAAAADAETALKNARIERDTILYAPVTGMADVFGAIKDYVGSIYGIRSPQVKQLTALPFSRR